MGGFTILITLECVRRRAYVCRQDRGFQDQVIDLATMTLVAVAGPDALDCIR